MLTRIRQRPMDPFTSLTRDLDRVFGAMLPVTLRPDWTENAPARVVAPAANLTEKDDSFVLDLDLPGVTLDDLEVLAEADSITIRGRRTFEQESENDTVHLSERYTGSFERSFTLPTEINPDKIDAGFADGVLHVVMPKAETPTRARRIAVRPAKATK